MTRRVPVRGAVAAILVLWACGTGMAAEPFPFDQDLLLELAHDCSSLSPRTIRILPVRGLRARGMTIRSWPRS